MSPLPAPANDLLTALSERRAASPTPLLKAQEHARSAEFSRTLRKKQTSEAGDAAEERLTEPSRAGDKPADKPEKTDGDGEKPDDDATRVDGDRTSAEQKPVDQANAGDELEPRAESPGAGADEAKSGATEKVDAGPVVAERAPDRPVTIRLINQQLLHGGLPIRLDPRELLSKPAAAGNGGLGAPQDVKTKGERGTDGGARVEPERGGATDGVDQKGTPTGEASRADSAPPEAKKEQVSAEPPRGRESAAAAQPQSVAPSSAPERAASAPARPDRAVAVVPGPLADLTRGPATKAAAGAESARPVVGVVGSRAGSAGRDAGGAGGGAGGAGSKAQSSAAAGGRGTEAASSTEANSAFRQQLMRGVSAAVAQARGGNGAGELVLHLQPANLGQVKVRVAFDQAKGGVSARFEVSSREARRIVDGSLEQLRASLESRGVGVDELEVRLAPRERPVSDPLGLISGTPYAEAKPDGSHSSAPALVNPDGGRGGEDAFHDSHGQAGQDARTDWGQGSTDAPRSSSSTPSDASAERLATIRVPDSVMTTGRDEGGALRLVVDAIA